MSDKVKSEANTWGLNLPAEDIPEEWEDDERMGFMFSTFKDRSMNPISWDAKMKFWKTNVQKYCVKNQLIHIDESTLKKAFERKGKFPACLLKVMEALKEEGQLTVRSEVAKHGYKGQTWAAWTKENIVAKPATFAVGKLWSALGYNQSQIVALAPGEKYVCLEALKSRAETLLSKHATDPECPHSTSAPLELSTVLREEGGNREDTELCLMWLCRQGKACVDETVNPPLVKFGHNANITSIDKQTHLLKKQDVILKRKLHELDIEKVKYENEAKEYLKKNMRPAAKSSLRKKHEVIKRMDKLVEAMTNVHMLMSHVEETESNAQVIESYKSAAAALKFTLKETGLSEESVINTMDEVEEVLDMHDDVKTLISQPVGSFTAVGDDDFEAELADLLAEPDTQGGDVGGGGDSLDINLADLPDVPNTSLTASIKTYN